MSLGHSRRFRNFDPGLYHEVTQRIYNGKFLLDPNCPRLKRAIYGQFAIALRRYSVKLLALQFMTDHFHALYMISCPYKFAKFLSFLHSGITRAYNRLQNEGVENDARTSVRLWHEMKWLPVSTDESTVRWRLGYILGQAVAAGLVDHPIEFPGASTVDAMLAKMPLSGSICDSTARYRDSRLKSGAMPEACYQHEIELLVTPPHCWADLMPHELRDRYIEICDSVAKIPFCDINAAKRTVPVAPTLAVAASALEKWGEPEDMVDVSSSVVMLGECQEELSVPVPKIHVPQRFSETGGVYEAGPPKEKPAYRRSDGRRKRIPLILSRLASVREGYAVAYSAWVEQYVEAKEAYRRAISGSPHGAQDIKIEIPRNFLFGSMPYP